MECAEVGEDAAVENGAVEFGVGRGGGGIDSIEGLTGLGGPVGELVGDMEGSPLAVEGFGEGVGDIFADAVELGGVGGLDVEVASPATAGVGLGPERPEAGGPLEDDGEEGEDPAGGFVGVGHGIGGGGEALLEFAAPDFPGGVGVVGKSTKEGVEEEVALLFVGVGLVGGVGDDGEVAGDVESALVGEGGHDFDAGGVVGSGVDESADPVGGSPLEDAL